MAALYEPVSKFNLDVMEERESCLIPLRSVDYFLWGPQFSKKCIFCNWLIICQFDPNDETGRCGFHRHYRLRRFAAYMRHASVPPHRSQHIVITTNQPIFYMLYIMKWYSFANSNLMILSVL